MYRLRDNIEELRGSLQPKESALEALQQTILEKEQVLVRYVCLIAYAKSKALKTHLLALCSDVGRHARVATNCRRKKTSFND